MKPRSRGLAQWRSVSVCPDIARANATQCKTRTLPEIVGNPIVEITAILVAMVNESGASIYSASDVAREEFPDQDLTVRGAVSIGRRLMDPLAELVKIDPKSIGVGQYQHDVDQTALKNGLDDVVVSCVNGVGVELNTASKQLLSYVSGLGPSLAGKIVAFRNENGPFRSRQDLLEGAAARAEGVRAVRRASCAIRGGEHPLDASAVHPESYAVVDRMAARPRLRGAATCCATRRCARASRRRGTSPSTVGLPTLHDILAELAKPGRDPRQEFEAFSFKDGVEKLEDLEPGMKLPGHRDQRHGLRCLRGHRRAPGRPGARQPAGRPLREGPGRGGEGAAEGERDRAGGGHPAEADRAVDALEPAARAAARGAHVAGRAPRLHAGVRPAKAASRTAASPPRPPGGQAARPTGAFSNTFADAFSKLRRN